MTIRAYDETKHDRFYIGEDKAFIGESFDWSGGGKKDGGAWATMVSPRYFLTATHAPPAYGGTITFYEDNTKDSPHSYTVDDWTYSPPCDWPDYNGQSIDYYDLCLRRLTADIPVEDNIAFYPVLALESDSEYIGMEIYAYGKTDRVGRNVVDDIRDVVLGTTPYSAVRGMVFNYDDPGVGDDECLLIGGDSGGPSFAICNGSLALVGIHSFNDGGASSPHYSGDNFVPYHIDELNANMEHGQSLTLVVPMPIPGDANDDGVVDDLDASILAANWQTASGAIWEDGDFNGDGAVNDLDASILAAHWQETNPWEGDSSHVPEPTVLVLLGGGFLFLVFWRWQRRRTVGG